MTREHEREVEEAARKFIAAGLGPQVLALYDGVAFTCSRAVWDATYAKNPIYVFIREVSP